jgi:hypothetical protein
MKQTLNFYLILFVIFLSGCQSAMNVFDKTDTQYERGLQHTIVKPIVYKDETKAIINITYLNAIDSSKWDDEYQNFLVGIYILEDNEIKTTQFLHNSRYLLTMNNKKFIKYTLFTKENALYKNIPLKNPWARYYIISFDKNENYQNLNLKYKTPIFGEVILSFDELY